MARTVVFFHAHPDDEVITTGGTIARCADEGHRTVVVFATRGELGEYAPDALAAGETLAQRRTAETEAAAEILGAHRVEYLGYHDSGMMGEPTNDAIDSFWQADLDEAGARLASIFDEERADALTIYDDHGGYGHPDHIQVHRVGLAAVRHYPVQWLYEASTDRDRMKAGIAENLALATEAGDTDLVRELSERLDTGFLDTLGSPTELLTTRLDVTAAIDRKRRALAAHASQVPESSFFLRMPTSAFAQAFGHETYIRHGATPGTQESILFATD